MRTTELKEPEQGAVFDQTGSLMRRTMEMLRERGDLLKIYTDTKISFYWLRKFANGEFRNPSVNRVQYLYEYLTGKQLDL